MKATVKDGAIELWPENPAEANLLRDIVVRLPRLVDVSAMQGSLTGFAARESDCDPLLLVSVGPKEKA